MALILGRRRLILSSLVKLGAVLTVAAAQVVAGSEAAAPVQARPILAVPAAPVKLHVAAPLPELAPVIRMTRPSSLRAIPRF